LIRGIKIACALLVRHTLCLGYSSRQTFVLKESGRNVLLLAPFAISLPSVRKNEVYGGLLTFWLSLFFLIETTIREKQDEEWETCVPVPDFDWKQIAEPVMKVYTETTDGSTIEAKKSGLVWHYQDADPDFGSCQAKELLDHLESVLSNEPVSVKSSQHFVEVKPQVLNPVQLS